MTSILLIEDEADLRNDIRSVLTEEGYQTLIAEDGIQGLHLAREHVPDLIICDVQMPKLSGYGVLSELRNNSRTAQIPFIFLTAQAAKDNFRTGMTLGADDYITKPFELDELLTAIATRLAKHAVVTKQLDDIRLSLSSVLPHELRTPLTGIKGLSQLLTNAAKLPEADEIADMGRSIHASAQRLEHVVENYLLYSQLKLTFDEPDKLKMWRFEQAPMSNFEIEEIVHRKAKEHQREADITFDLTDQDLNVSGMSLKKIIEELVDNACKFSDPGEPITITTEVDRFWLIITVEDNGLGMTKDQIASIGAYAQFGRQMQEQQGSGLGLTIAKLLAELLGGHLTVKSAPGRGTAVRVEFNPASNKHKDVMSLKNITS